MAASLKCIRVLLVGGLFSIALLALTAPGMCITVLCKKKMPFSSRKTGEDHTVMTIFTQILSLSFSACTDPVRAFGN